MVTTRSQDKTTFADSIRAKGFSLADCTGLYVAVRAEIKSMPDERTTDRFHTGHDHGRSMRHVSGDDAAALRLDAATA